MEVKVRLKASDIARAKKVSNDKQEHFRQKQQPDTKKIANRPGDEIDFEGALAELAVARATGLQWHAEYYSQQEYKSLRHVLHDVGDLEVRETTHSDGHLILRKRQICPFSPYVLVILEKRLARLVGWCLGKEGRCKKNWKDLGGYGRPNYMVKQEKLNDMEILFRELRRPIPPYVADEDMMPVLERARGLNVVERAKVE